MQESMSLTWGTLHPQGVVFAVEEWVREGFNLTAASIGVEYDSENSRYVFTLEGEVTPFSDKLAGVSVSHSW